MSDINKLFGELLQKEALFNKEGNLTSAIICLQQVVELLMESDQKKELAGCLNNLGLLQVTAKEYDQALHSFEKALKIYKELRISEQEAEALQGHKEL